MKRYYLVQEDKDSNGRHYAYSVGISYEGECAPPERTYYFSQDTFLKEKWFDSLEKAREYAQKVKNGVIAANDMPKREFTKADAEDIISYEKTFNNSGLIGSTMDGDVYNRNLARAGFDEAESDLIMASLVMSGVKFVFKE